MKRQLISAVRRQNTGKNRFFIIPCRWKIRKFPVYRPIEADRPGSGGYFRRRVPPDAEQVIALLSPLEKKRSSFT